MKVSYEGIGQWAATFACDQAHEGEVVKITGSGTVGPCAAGDSFCGRVLPAGGLGRRRQRRRGRRGGRTELSGGGCGQRVRHRNICAVKRGRAI